MFQRIRQWDLVTSNGRVYRPPAYADPQADGRWGGWLVFFPVGDGEAVATERETTQTTFEALTVWAAGLTSVYLEGALIRALELADQPSVIAQLEDAEYDAEGCENAVTWLGRTRERHRRDDRGAEYERHGVSTATRLSGSAQVVPATTLDAASARCSDGRTPRESDRGAAGSESSSQSRHSVRAVRTNRSATPLACGARAGVRTTSIPSLRNTSSKSLVNF